MLLLLSPSLAQNLIRLPSKTECRTLATPENCLTKEMQHYCQPACAEQHNREILKQNRFPIAPKARSFYELNALDIHGNPVDFQQFRDKVVVVTNVASYCGKCVCAYNCSCVSVILY